MGVLTKFGVISLIIIALVGCKKQDVGVIAGGAVGGLVGSQFGGGTGQLVATAGGALLGAYLGGQLGRNIDETDKLRTARALESSRTGHTTSWQNPDNGAQYAVTPTRTFNNQNNQPCREFNQQAIIAGETQNIYGTACREADGSWRVVNSK